jgi:hypothetical protein
MTYNFDTPEGRYAAIEALGPERYNEAMAEHRKNSVIKVVAGREFCRIRSSRFGELIAVGEQAFTTLEAAAQFAQEHPREP